MDLVARSEHNICSSIVRVVSSKVLVQTRRAKFLIRIAFWLCNPPVIEICNKLGIKGSRW